MINQVEAAGGEKQAATPMDCQWYKMYLEIPMLNVPKFHVEFHHRFRLPYARSFSYCVTEKNAFHAGVAGIARYHCPCYL
jgi:hypothetical protein